MAEYIYVLPLLNGDASTVNPLRRHQSYSIRCPAKIYVEISGGQRSFVMTVIGMSFSGFQAKSKLSLPLGHEAVATIDLGAKETWCVRVIVLRRKESNAGAFYGLRVIEPDVRWRNCVASLESGLTAINLMRY